MLSLRARAHAEDIEQVTADLKKLGLAERLRSSRELSVELAHSCRCRATGALALTAEISSMRDFIRISSY
jgi:hypothetical protein